MTVKQVDELQLKMWINGLVKQQQVYGVQTKEGRFAYGPLTKAEDLRLDYDVTMLPPKKYFQPPQEALVQFTRGTGKCEPVLEEEPFVLLGVHPYDAAAISQMDKIFSTDNADVHYLRRREGATIIASDIQNASENIFASCMGTATLRSGGCDMLLTKVGDQYIVEARTEKGEALLTGPLADAPAASEASLAKREQLWEDAEKRFAQHQLQCRPQELPELLSRSDDNSLWEERGARCLSCGSCTLVCPTWARNGISMTASGVAGRRR